MDLVEIQTAFRNTEAVDFNKNRLPIFLYSLNRMSHCPDLDNCFMAPPCHL